ncbi:hypothetical protein PAXINDRAFT_91567 [Paxillus involutus ATCC 200175]|jgi:hypothetical protein|uniref:Uncharacterized protein n=1 Tax=Paxillus involutus ATCC 200175 TaxID=664439 RepID=A0A0C9SVQ1_PAXIN|nr:hypothetical protein PAXINDRAFT_91567 [Paxillus involutus ATCC 200175]
MHQHYNPSRLHHDALTGDVSPCSKVALFQRAVLGPLRSTHTSHAKRSKTHLEKLPAPRRPIQQFLYRATHGSLVRVGDFWSNIPTYEHCARCHTCGECIENLEHILTDYSSIERRTIWGATAKIWPRQYGAWPDISLGTIRGCGPLTLPPAPQNDRQRPTATTPLHTRGASPLLRILISEAAHLICARESSEIELTPKRPQDRDATQ